MKSLERSAGRPRHRASGFSLAEMIIVVALIFITTVVSVVSLVPVLQAQHVTNAYNTTLAAMRQARDNAVAQRTVYSVTFSKSVTPNTIAVAWVPATGQTTLNNGSVPPTFTFPLPTDVTFQTNSAITATTPPDSSTGASFGAGANAIDFGYTGSSSTGIETIYFCPDGSAQTVSSCSGVYNWDDGVVYMAQGTNLLSSRAVDLWGGTGRVRGWRLYAKSGGGGYQWVRQ
jgi:Tfp pilus assembly protein FimT